MESERQQRKVSSSSSSGVCTPGEDEETFSCSSSFPPFSPEASSSLPGEESLQPVRSLLPSPESLLLPSSNQSEGSMSRNIVSSSCSPPPSPSPLPLPEERGCVSLLGSSRRGDGDSFERDQELSADLRGLREAGEEEEESRREEWRARGRAEAEEKEERRSMENQVESLGDVAPPDDDEQILVPFFRAGARAGGGDFPSSPIIEMESPPPQTIEAPPRRKRLMIERVVLENFKSYGKKKVIGPFHKVRKEEPPEHLQHALSFSFRVFPSVPVCLFCLSKHFTAIVGPNGSGKSNVIDAMLFVFGRRAQQIRLKNVLELIHNSASPSFSSSASPAEGKKHPPKSTSSSASSSSIQSARVTIFFQEIIDTVRLPARQQAPPPLDFFFFGLREKARTFRQCSILHAAFGEDRPPLSFLLRVARASPPLSLSLALSRPNAYGAVRDCLGHHVYVYLSIYLALSICPSICLSIYVYMGIFRS